jgi:hypothetical protein
MIKVFVIKNYYLPGGTGANPGYKMVNVGRRAGKIFL